MINRWTSEDIEQILIQLNSKALPFKHYAFTCLNQGLNLLGKGGFANVYEAETRDKHKKSYAIKVIGFGDRYVDLKNFRKAVDAQKEIGQFQKGVVKIIDSIELRVWIKDEHTVIKVERIYQAEKEIPKGAYLTLQFVVMEKISSIVKYEKSGSPFLRPEKLARADENEILKLAYDIGMALSQSHAKKLIHRDIKLENIFYSEKKACYKIGDFGIAKTTDDGMASTIAFTKGYGAPEIVGALEDRYDNTADIYSFGITLYVLLNEMRFPESSNYHVNLKVQYSNGYTVPLPLHGSDELHKIVSKMCSFYPDDRYQSMDEVLKDLDKLIYSREVKYQREHNVLPLVMGSVFALAGSAIGKLAFMPTLKLELSIWMYIFLIFCVGKGILSILKMNSSYVSLIICCVGLYITYNTGITWWKIILLFAISFVLDIAASLLGGGILLANAVYWIAGANTQIMQEFYELKWAVILLFSLALILLYQYSLFRNHEQLFSKLYRKWSWYWILGSIFYAAIIIFDYSVSLGLINNQTLVQTFGGRLAAEMSTWNLKLTGICGLVFCIVWIGREAVLIFYENIHESQKR